MLPVCFLVALAFVCIAYAASRGLRERDADGSSGVLSAGAVDSVVVRVDLADARVAGLLTADAAAPSSLSTSCGIPFLDYRVSRQYEMIGAGTRGEVFAAAVEQSGSAIAPFEGLVFHSVPIRRGGSYFGSGQFFNAMLKVQLNKDISIAQKDARSELYIGSLACGVAALCAPETPVVSYIGTSRPPGAKKASVLLESVVLTKQDPPDDNGLGPNLEDLLTFTHTLREREIYDVEIFERQWKAYTQLVSPLGAGGDERASRLSVVDASLVVIQQAVTGLWHLAERGIVHR